MNDKRITPSVGRKVWYYANEHQHAPLDATIVKVHAPEGEATPDTCCNLHVHDADSSEVFIRTSVSAVHPEQVPSGEHFRWMPHQLGQAKKEA